MSPPAIAAWMRAREASIAIGPTDTNYTARGVQASRYCDEHHVAPCSGRGC